VAFGPGLDITDGVTPETSLATAMDNASTGIRVSKNGGNLIDRNSGTAPVHDEVGWYGVNLSTADTDTLGALQILFSGATVNLPIWMEFMIVPANVWDSLFGADVLQTDVTQWLGTAAATPTVAGVPEVDVTHMAGGVQTVTDLKDFADAGYDPGTNKIQGVVLVDTTTDNSDMRGTDSAALASVATEARLAELDAGNLPTDIAAIPTTAMRGTDSAALASVATEARLAELDAANIPADIDAIPTTAMRGTDNSATASVLGAAVGASISADIAAVETKVDTADTVVDALATTLGTAGAGLTDLGGMSTGMIAEVNAASDAAFVTYDGPTKTELDTGLGLLATEAKQDIIDTVVDGIQTDLSNGTDGLGALKTLIDTVDSEVGDILLDTAEIGTAGAGLTNVTLANDLSTTMKTSVQTAVDAAIDTAISELTVAAPTATPTLRTGLMLLYMALRNKLIVQTSGTDALEVHNDAGTKIASKAITDDTSDYTEAKMS
jgi:hypothetical protein